MQKHFNVKVQEIDFQSNVCVLAVAAFNVEIEREKEKKIYFRGLSYILFLVVTKNVCFLIHELLMLPY